VQVLGIPFGRGAQAVQAGGIGTGKESVWRGEMENQGCRLERSGTDGRGGAAVVERPGPSVLEEPQSS
jgi:hypothetical protein